MKKIDILKKIEEQVARGIKNPNLGGDPVGLKITKQALKKSKEENEDYYKELDKKFRDYMKLDVKDNPSPKVNGTEEDHKMYYGTGMEGLKYDDEGTEKYKKFVERNKELNKPSKDYYLTKDEVSDNYDSIMKDGETYKKHKYEKPDEYQKTPKVRITKESTDKKTMKQLSYKKPFLSYERTMTLIPESYKIDGNKFMMTDGVETYTIKWEGNNDGNPTVLMYKNDTLVKEDVKKMKHLYDYKSQETLMKTNDALTENEIFRELMGKSRLLVNEQTAPAAAPTTGSVTGGTKFSGTKINNVTYQLPGIKDENTLNKFLQTRIQPNNENMISVLGNNPKLTFSPNDFEQTGSFYSQLVLSLVDALNAHAIKGQPKPFNTFDNLNTFIKAVTKSDALTKLDLTPEQKDNYLKYYSKILTNNINELNKK
jgi:hypothetical protein